MWAMAAEKAGDVAPEAVVANAGGLSFDAPQGKVNFAANNCLRANSILARGTPGGNQRCL